MKKVSIENGFAKTAESVVVEGPTKGAHSAHCGPVDRSFRASDRCRLVLPSQQSKVRWLNGRASDYESGGSRFDPWVDRFLLLGGRPHYPFCWGSSHSHPTHHFGPTFQRIHPEQQSRTSQTVQHIPIPLDLRMHGQHSLNIYKRSALLSLPSFCYSFCSRPTNGNHRPVWAITFLHHPIGLSSMRHWIAIVSLAPSQNHSTTSFHCVRFSKEIP